MTSPYSSAEVPAVNTESSPPLAEFVVILSMMISLVALSIDAMLPALSQIGSDLGIASPNDRQLVIGVIFLGTALGQLVLGPLSDRTGRKTAIYIGFAVFMVGTLVAMFAGAFTVLLAGRVMQGLGISAAQGVGLALVRDRYEGKRMARVMSFVMTVFILVPMIAPSIGQGIMLLVGWRGIFGSFLLFALISVTWFALRVPETLAEENRAEFSLRRIVSAIREILGIRTSVGYLLVAGLAQGIFISYLNTSQQIFQDQYNLGELFPLFFAIISVSLGLASFANSRLVMRYGMSLLARIALGGQLVLAVVFLGIAAFFGGQPPLWGLMTYLMLFFFGTGILFGNMNSMAMQPLGHLAGIGAAVVVSLATLVAMALGTLIGRSYDGTILPFVIGMVVLTATANLVLRWAESERSGAMATASKE